MSSHPPVMSWKGQNRGAAWWRSSNPVVTKKSPFDHSFRATPGPAIRSMSGAAVPFASTMFMRRPPFRRSPRDPAASGPAPSAAVS